MSHAGLPWSNCPEQLTATDSPESAVVRLSSSIPLNSHCSSIDPTSKSSRDKRLDVEDWDSAAAFTAKGEKKPSCHTRPRVMKKSFVMADRKRACERMIVDGRGLPFRRDRPRQAMYVRACTRAVAEEGRETVCGSECVQGCLVASRTSPEESRRSCFVEAPQYPTHPAPGASQQRRR